MVNLNNPAARLLHVLRRLGATDGDTPARRAWANALDVDPDNLPRLLERLAVLFQLPLEAKRQLERQPDLDQETCLRWFPRVEKALGDLNLEGSIAGCLNHLDEGTIYGLEFDAAYLGRQAPESIVPETELAIVEAEVRELCADLAGSSLEPAARRYLLEQLDPLAAAIANYDLLGSTPLRRAVDAAVGSLLTDPHRRAETTRTKLGERCWKVIARAAALLAAGQPMPELAGPVRQLLPAAFKTVRRRPARRP